MDEEEKGKVGGKGVIGGWYCVVRDERAGGSRRFSIIQEYVCLCYIGLGDSRRSVIPAYLPRIPSAPGPRPSR